MYPRIVKLDDPKLKSLIQQKEELVLSGRKESGEIDLIQAEMTALDKKIVKAESKVDVSDLRAEFKEIEEEVLRLIKKGDEVQKRMFERMKAQTPQEYRDTYEKLEKLKAEKENNLSKTGHKVQKVKDKIIPLIQKLGKPHLEDEFEDFSTSRLDDNGTPVLEIFSHLEDWETNFRTKK